MPPMWSMCAWVNRTVGRGTTSAGQRPMSKASLSSGRSMQVSSPPTESPRTSMPARRMISRAYPVAGRPPAARVDAADPRSDPTQGCAESPTVHNRLLALLLGFVLAALLGEAGARWTFPADVNGDVYVSEQRLLPYHLPKRSALEFLERLEQGRFGHLAYDPDCGWSTVPGSENESDGGFYDAAGIRTATQDEQYQRERAPGTLRIALFGDSYTHGSEVATERTWGRVLERELAAAGVKTEVLNFGVGGYGMDQALQRWRSLGRAYAPDLVLLGFQAENVQRNLNLIRPLKNGGFDGLSFSKPRFVLGDGKLVLINHPALPPERLPALLSDLEAWPLLQHEFFYEPDKYRARWWSASRLLTLLGNALVDLDENASGYNLRFYQLAGEGARLTRNLIAAFEREVEQRGARFALVHLPKRNDLDLVRRRGKTTYAALLHKLDERHRLIDPLEPLLAAYKERGRALFAPGRHYGELANRIVGEAVARALLAEGETVPAASTESR